MPVKSAVRLGSGLFSDFRVGSFFAGPGKIYRQGLKILVSPVRFLVVPLKNQRVAEMRLSFFLV